MNEALQLLLMLLFGGVLGALFFGGLWWTLQRLSTANHAALLMLSSAVIRMAVAVLGFYISVRIGIYALLACLAGFILARIWLTRKLRHAQVRTTPEAGHAP